MIFPQSNWKNRREIEYSLIGAKFMMKIEKRTLNTVKTIFSQIS
jgi:hypothetical protein